MIDCCCQDRNKTVKLNTLVGTEIHLSVSDQ